MTSCLWYSICDIVTSRNHFEVTLELLPIFWNIYPALLLNDHHQSVSKEACYSFIKLFPSWFDLCIFAPLVSFVDLWIWLYMFENTKKKSVGFSRCPLCPWSMKSHVLEFSVLIVLRFFSQYETPPSKKRKPQKCSSTLVITFLVFSWEKVLRAKSCYVILVFKQMCILSITMVSLDFWKTVATSAGELPLINLVSRPPAVTRSCMQAHRDEHVDLSRTVGPRACHSHSSQHEAGPRKYSTDTSCLGGPEAAVLGWNMTNAPPTPTPTSPQPPASWPWNRVVTANKWKYNIPG